VEKKEEKSRNCKFDPPFKGEQGGERNHRSLRIYLSKRKASRKSHRETKNQPAQVREVQSEGTNDLAIERRDPFLAFKKGKKTKKAAERTKND